MPADVKTMIVEFILPDLGEGLEEAEVVEWHLPEGAEVQRDQVFVAVETDKSVVELPSPVTGRLRSYGAAAGEVVRVGHVLATFEAGEAASIEPAPPAAATDAPQATTIAFEPGNGSGVGATTIPLTQPRRAGRVLAAPSVRRRAVERSVDLAAVPGSGPGGRVLAEDLDRYLVDPVPTPAPPTTPDTTIGRTYAAAPARVDDEMIPVRGVRKATAALTTQSWSTIPHVTQMDEVDATELLDLRARAKASTGRGIGVLPFAVMAVARALRRYPLVNATFDADAMVIRQHARIDIAIAVATDDGLVVPVIRSADALDLPGIVSEVERLADRARHRAVTPDELRGATFTITNYGMYGGRFGMPIIRPPEVGILGLGAIKPRPFVVADAVVARPTLPCVFAADHRLIDGDVLIGFLEHIMASLSDPISMLLTSSSAEAPVAPSQAGPSPGHRQEGRGAVAVDALVIRAASDV